MLLKVGNYTNIPSTRPEYYIGMIVFSIVFGIMFFIVSKKNEALKNKPVIYLILGSGASVSLTAFLGMLPVLPIYIFILCQSFNLILGSIYTYILRKYFSKKFNNSFLSEVLLTTTIAAFGAFGFTLLFQQSFIEIKEFGVYFTTSVIPFIIPLLFMKSFDNLAEIPPPIYKVWYYPDFPEEPDLDKLDLNKIYVLELEFSKVPFQSVSNFKLKAPIEMNFGEWFMMFINNYNDKFAESPIQYLDNTGKSYGWIFYTKSTFFKPKKFIDPDLSVTENKLKENITIVSLRVEENKS